MVLALRLGFVEGLEGGGNIKEGNIKEGNTINQPPSAPPRKRNQIHGFEDDVSVEERRVHGIQGVVEGGHVVSV